MHESRDVKRDERRSIRLRDYDYRQAGAYFVTVCTQQRSSLFGEVEDDTMRLNAWGEVVVITWNNLPDAFRHVMLDAFVVMPNHVHGIVVMNVDARRGEAADALSRFGRRDSLSAASPLQPVAHGTAAGGLGAVIQTFKSTSTRRTTRSGMGQACLCGSAIISSA